LRNKPYNYQPKFHPRQWRNFSRVLSRNFSKKNMISNIMFNCLFD